MCDPYSFDDMPNWEYEAEPEDGDINEAYLPPLTLPTVNNKMKTYEEIIDGDD